MSFSSSALTPSTLLSPHPTRGAWKKCEHVIAGCDFLKIIISAKCSNRATLLSLPKDRSSFTVSLLEGNYPRRRLFLPCWQQSFRDSLPAQPKSWLPWEHLIPREESEVFLLASEDAPRILGQQVFDFFPGVPNSSVLYKGRYSVISSPEPIPVWCAWGGIFEECREGFWDGFLLWLLTDNTSNT